MVAHKNSPCDPSLKTYWEERHNNSIKRLKKAKFLRGRDGIAILQGYKCPWCKQDLGVEKLNLHHIQPKSHGGKDTYDNLVLIHENCHHSIHALGATNPNIQERLRNGKTKPTGKRTKSQKAHKPAKPVKKVAKTLSSKEVGRAVCRESRLYGS